MNKYDFASLSLKALVALVISIAPVSLAFAGSSNGGSNALPSVLSSGSGSSTSSGNGSTANGSSGASAHMPIPTQSSWTPPPTPSMGESVFTQAGPNTYSIGRQVVFGWTPDKAYTILLRPGAVTDIIMANGESPEHMVIGDTSRFLVQKTNGDVFVKPIRSGLYSSATLITTKHRYQLLLVSVPPGSPWYQSVAWRSPGFSPAGSNMLAFSSGPSSGASQPSSANAPQSNDGGDAAPGGQGESQQNTQGAFGLVQAMNVAYRIHGDAPWTPIKVFSIHHKTYIEFPKHTDNLPALFVKPSSGVPFSLGNYVVRGGYIVYPHLFKAAMLRLGGQRVYITRQDGSKG